LPAVAVAGPPPLQDSEVAESTGSSVELVLRRFDAADPGPSHDTALLHLLLDAEPPPAAQAIVDHQALDRAIGQLESPDERQRLEAALLLQGGSGPLRHTWSARELGLDFVLRLAEHWLKLARRNPRQALILRWSLQNLDHDSPRLLQELAELCREESSRAAAAAAALQNLEVIDPECGETLAEILRRGPAMARRAVVRGLPNGLAAGGPFADALWMAVGEHLPAAAAAMEQESVDLNEPLDLLEVAEKAAGPDSPERAHEIYQELNAPWAELLKKGGEELRQSLVNLGRCRKVGRAALRIAPAVDALAGKSELVPVLAGWLETRLRHNVSRNGLDDHEATFLLELLAAAAPRLPQTFVTATADRPRWRRLLSEAAIHYDWLPARIAAVELLSFGQELGGDEVEALFTAMLDSPEAQQRALASLSRYRRLESLAILERLETELGAPSGARAFAAGRLLAALGRPGLGDPALRRRIDEMLERAIRREDSSRPVFLSKCLTGERPAAIENLGPLAQLLEHCQLELKVAAGFPEIPPWPRSAA
jgi:hypothetical protein